MIAGQAAQAASMLDYPDLYFRLCWLQIFVLAAVNVEALANNHSSVVINAGVSTASSGLAYLHYYLRYSGNGLAIVMVSSPA